MLTYRHSWAHSISILPLSPQSEHSPTVLMRHRIKQQTEGLLCSPSPPQRSCSLGVEKHCVGGGRMENRSDRKPTLKNIQYVIVNILVFEHSTSMMSSISLTHTQILIYSSLGGRHPHAGFISLPPFHPLVELSNINGTVPLVSAFTTL